MTNMFRKMLHNLLYRHRLVQSPGGDVVICLRRRRRGAGAVIGGATYFPYPDSKGYRLDPLTFALLAIARSPEEGMAMYRDAPGYLLRNPERVKGFLMSEPSSDLDNA
jgi:hypothetical protein